MKNSAALFAALLIAPWIGSADVLFLFSHAIAHSAETKPNIIFVLFDDLGWGQPQSYNPKSALRTPNLDKLASQAMRFTDAHTPAQTKKTSP